MTNSLRVLHLLDELRPSGAEVMLATAADEFDRRGVTGSVAATGRALGSYAGTLAAAGWDTLHLPLPDGAPGLPGHLRRLTAVAREHDVVHLHAERASGPQALGLRLARVPVVRTIHNVFAFGGALRLERTVLRALQRATGVDQYGCGPSVAAHEASHFRNDVGWLPNWFDDRRFDVPTSAERTAARAALGLAPADRAVVVVANCNAAKNHRSLLTALARVDRPDLLLLHAGMEPDDGERRLADDLGVTDRVRFLGRVDDVPALLRAADLYAMPSLHEGFSIAALEALGTGLPALLSDAAGVRDLADLLPPGAAAFPSPTSSAIAEALGGWASGDWGDVPPDRVREAVVRTHGRAAGADAWTAAYRRAVGR